MTLLPNLAATHQQILLGFCLQSLLFWINTLCHCCHPTVGQCQPRFSHAPTTLGQCHTRLSYVPTPRWVSAILCSHMSPPHTGSVPSSALTCALQKDSLRHLCGCPYSLLLGWPLGNCKAHLSISSSHSPKGKLSRYRKFKVLDRTHRLHVTKSLLSLFLCFALCDPTTRASLFPVLPSIFLWWDP